MNHRQYTTADREACLAIFDSNAERYFSPADREDFAAFLDSPPGFFGVLEDEHGVGCGGIGVRPGTDCAVMMWGMIHASRHGQGLGKLLALARLRKLADLPPVRKVILNTSGETVGFYQKIGFRVVERIPDGYRRGLDRYRMEMAVEDLMRG
jgi:ribosomal protein S18 acetylase RimI-like enzyme